ncbi:ribosomal protein S18-alanine N-acetyltransferase [Marinimicrobium sp. ABcell2]|uniref:ribosomal protein S18-alanine N-acetyltransferase n=1 Tax=Marinimicrobium sp. ABcell2 TaxID=3069751 RepID=UPI0027AF31B5|nr:ribosomal protein S18-alanine N-acetyltransferase [Marinimicrobium sp. ABcell2]MDQ2077736.1 ribosomal protein S18-alanine N-acetyltransferase [Marinimicrobium sp. ABcell2]
MSEELTQAPTAQVTSTGAPIDFHALETADLPAVLGLERKVQSHPWEPSSFEDCLRGRHKCWLAKHGDQLLGFVVLAWAGGEAELLNIAVDPSNQGQGIGRCLLRAAIELAQPHAEMMFLEVRVSNRKAINFYYQEDFFEVGVRRDYYPGVNGREDALVLARQL